VKYFILTNVVVVGFCLTLYLRGLPPKVVLLSLAISIVLLNSIVLLGLWLRAGLRSAAEPEDAAATRKRRILIAIVVAGGLAGLGLLSIGVGEGWPQGAQEVCSGVFDVLACIFILYRLLGLGHRVT